MDRYNYKIEGDVAKFYFERRNGEVVEALIDSKNLKKVLEFKYKWHPHYYKCIDGYYIEACQYIGMFNGKAKYQIVLLHRFLTDAEKKTHVDHKNHITTDNREENLRVVSTKKNLTNRLGANANSTTGVRNVCYDKRENKYVVQLQVDGKGTVFGRFDNLEDAEECANYWRKKIYGEVK